MIDQNQLEVKKSHIKGAGHGLYTNIAIKKGDVISMFIGDRTKAILDYKDMLYSVYLSDGTYINTRPFEGKAKFANDAQFNTLFHNNSEIVEKTINGIVEACLIATCDIPKGSEIFLDYGDEYW